MKKYLLLNDAEKESLLRNEYETNNLSLSEIAKKYDTYTNKVRRDAIKFGLRIRDKSEAQKLVLSLGKTVHPTKGKERSDEDKTKIGLGVMNNWKDMDIQQLEDRQQKARENWNNLSKDSKDNMLSLANAAVRKASRSGSKLEKFFLQALLADGFKVEFHKEQSLLNTRLQIDIFLPEIDTAIEIDGPSHYEPVWGEDSLKKNIKYDQKKTGLILGKGLILIRVKQIKDFSPARARVLYADLKRLLDSSTGLLTKDNRYFTIGE